MEPIDQVTCESDEVLGQDKASLALVRDLRVLLVDVIQALDDDPVPHGMVDVLMGPDASIQ
jgi:hypothetical protein